MHRCRALVPMALLALLTACDPPDDSSVRTAGSTAAPAADQQPVASSEKPKEADEAAIVDMLRGPGHGQQATGQLPPGHPPLGGQPMASPSVPQAPPTNPDAMPLTFTAPEDWQPQQPSNQMRRYQYGVAGPAGEPVGEVVVFAFSGGGPVAANLDRWRRQFKQADGSEIPPEQVKLEQFEVGGFTTTLMEVAGHYTNSMMPGMGGGEEQAGFRMIAAVIETDHGPWFIKATGPDDVIAGQREAILKFILSAEASEGS